MLDPEDSDDGDSFGEYIGVAGDCDGEGFFRYDLHDLDLDGFIGEDSILDKGNERVLKKILDREEKRARKHKD